jgi:hypothetical protein
MNLFITTHTRHVEQCKDAENDLGRAPVLPIPTHDRARAACGFDPFHKYIFVFVFVCLLAIDYGVGPWCAPWTPQRPRVHIERGLDASSEGGCLMRMLAQSLLSTGQELRTNTITNTK